MTRLMRITWRTGVRGLWGWVLVALALLSFAVAGFSQDTKKDGKAQATRPVFAEADAVRVLDGLRQALESNSRSRFLKMFDAQRMPGYAAFRDEVDEFFATYDSMRMNYHMSQVAIDGEFGAVVAQITIEATPRDGTPSLRRDAQVRLVLSWDGKAWKIADLAPRGLIGNRS